MRRAASRRDSLPTTDTGRLRCGAQMTNGPRRPKRTGSSIWAAPAARPRSRFCMKLRPAAVIRPPVQRLRAGAAEGPRCAHSDRNVLRTFLRGSSSPYE